MVGRRSALNWLELLTPRLKGAARVVRDVAYGEHARHRLDIYEPGGRAQRAPVLLFIHGGGWDSGTKADYGFAGHAYAGAGFVTVIADYRLVPEVHYPDFLVDGGLALDWIDDHIGRHGGDRQRIFLMGHSAGAYNAVMLGLAGPDYGAPDFGPRLRGVVGVSGPYDFYPFDVPASIAAFGQAPDPRSTQPVNRILPPVPPIYLGHGTRDTTCGLYNTQNLAARLRAAGQPVVERHYRWRGHVTPLLSLFPVLRFLAPVYRETVAFMRNRS